MTTGYKLAASSLFVLVILGCSNTGDRPELGEVTGKVTMDGKPLAGVIVNFNPENGRAGTAETDSEGNYELIYRYGVNGTKVGPNKVSFEWPMGAEGKQGIPAKYAGKSELTADVKSGSNTFDFELTSK